MLLIIFGPTVLLKLQISATFHYTLLQGYLNSKPVININCQCFALPINSLSNLTKIALMICILQQNPCLLYLNIKHSLAFGVANMYIIVTRRIIEYFKSNKQTKLTNLIFCISAPPEGSMAHCGGGRGRGNKTHVYVMPHSYSHLMRKIGDN